MRLKVVGRVDEALLRYVFQFQTGAIKSLTDMFSVASLGSSFNSKLVRLKEDVNVISSYAGYGFQFQTGAIKSLLARSRLRLLRGFNSKLVRLKAPSARCLFESWEFQFQTGAIKRRICGWLFPLLCLVSIPNWCD